jgi:fluoride exporter
VVTGAALVLLGGFFGGILRFWLSGLVGRAVGETFPWGTLVVNITGASAVGALVGSAETIGGPLATETIRDLAIIGFFGSYTTVSSFSLQTLNLALDGQFARAALNVALSTVLCVAGLAAGYLIAWSILA